MNPVTKERMTFLKTAAETKGEYVLIELRAAPGSVVAASHVHPHQTETFEVLSGKLGAKIGRKTVEAVAGGVVVIEPRVSHKWWNAGEDELVFRAEVRPALQFEQLIETMFGLAADGKTNKKGMPNPLRLAVIANHHFDDVQLPVVPRWMQKAALALGAPIGRSLGFQPNYAPAGELAYGHDVTRGARDAEVDLPDHPGARPAHARCGRVGRQGDQVRNEAGGAPRAPAGLREESNDGEPDRLLARVPTRGRPGAHRTDAQRRASSTRCGTIRASGSTRPGSSTPRAS